MSDLKIPKLTSELEKEIYRINLNISDKIFLYFERDSLENYPYGNMAFWDPEKEEAYLVPLNKPGDLRSLADTIDSLEEEILKDNLKEVSKNLYDTELKYLKELPDTLSQEVREDVLDKIKEVKKHQKERCQKLDEHFSEIEYIEKFYDPSKIEETAAKMKRSFFNIINFGKYEEDFKLDMDHNTTQVIAWDVLTKITDELYQSCEKNAKYLKEIGDSKLSEKIDEIARFYGNISYYADFGKKYLNSLRNRDVSEYGEMFNYTSPDLDSICEQILTKVNNRDIKISSKE